ncbi:nitrous oxide reductase accessory protein NosL [Microbulbifer sp. OS29]|uniref:Nitrous oxide reductase accessory protein NosL n=1 Tax=Microbulbifer okhotskensis TaxID=2926617 RepID=A0A9X2J7B4_9GAMM|nr:nitrous oxide reductase accessory protein NosL [Microbulbifer okhotskensis]MCO1336389.1 nitrous oxide reductase accessory protein NosL [Microbulbifer okhotskensis]
MRYLLTNIFPVRGLLVLLVSIALLVSCTKDKQVTMVQQVVAIESGEECHLCGMIIANYPGPKGQLFSKGIVGNLKFCSTRDMFAFIVDPENRHNVQKAFVHDMAVTPWDHPDEETYVDARKAWYVIGHSKQGSMGATLASFAREQDAWNFADAEGGEVLDYDQINLQALVSMTRRH